MGCEYTQETDGLDAPQTRARKNTESSGAFEIKKLPAWGQPAKTDGFQWPTMTDLEEMDDTDFHLKAIHFKSISDGLNLGICQVHIELSNGETFGEFKVDGVKPSSEGALKLPAD